MEYLYGEEIEVRIDREGLGQNVGVAHLPDETMVVIAGAGGRVGESIHATIVGMEKTPIGLSFLANACQ